MKYIQFDTESKYIKDFISLSKKLYKKDNTENPKEIRQILTNKHPLNNYFKLAKFLIYDNEKTVARFVITTYQNDDIAYIGFFESIDNEEVAAYLFKIAREYAKNNNYKKIVGPVDASFWIKYRLKINMFDKIPYTAEPYNKEYYYKMFLNNNYKVIEHYTSNIYQNVQQEFEHEKFETRYNNFIKNGYKIESPNMDEFDSIIRQMYYLLTDLYSDFPIYKNLSEDDFVSTFSSYKMIINPQMVKFAYYEDKMVGFFIGIPNYNNRVYHLNLINILKILKTRKKPKEYVMLYIGADKEHKGLGSSLTYSIINELRGKELPCIGALARDGKVTQDYVKELIKDRYEYVLMEDDLSD